MIGKAGYPATGGSMYGFPAQMTFNQGNYGGQSFMPQVHAAAPFMNAPGGMHGGTVEMNQRGETRPEDNTHSDGGDEKQAQPFEEVNEESVDKHQQPSMGEPRKSSLMRFILNVDS